MSGSARKILAVIDIGSNSIKVLVATRADGGLLRPLLSRTIDAPAPASATRPRN